MSPATKVNMQKIEVMKQIRWTREERKFIIIPDNCYILIPAEYNKFYIEGTNGFKLFHCDFGWGFNYVVFLWKGFKEEIEIDDTIDFLSNKRFPLIGEQILITCTFPEPLKAHIKIEKYEDQSVESEIIQLEKEVPYIEWNIETMQIPEECKIKIPIEYNCIHATTSMYLKLARYDDEESDTGKILFWTVPLKRVLTEVKNRSQAFDVTELNPLMPCFLLKKGIFEIDKKEILAIELSVNFELTENLRVFRRLSFSPIKVKKDWWTEANTLIK